MKNLLFGFEGRVNRAKFWLVAIGIVVVQSIAFSALGGAAMMQRDPELVWAAMGPGAALAMTIVLLLSTWISVAVAVKRYHDRNKSGWWILIIFVPVIGGLWYLIECGFLPGTSGPNSYGSDPLSTL